MDKYGVEQNPEIRKQAGEDMMCPQCGAELVGRQDGTLWCPACGTEPFESSTKEAHPGLE